VPINVDYSDLWNVLAFFRGSPALLLHQLKLNHTIGGLYGENAHLDLAETISKAGQEFAKRCLRYEDMEICTLRIAAVHKMISQLVYRYVPTFDRIWASMGRRQRQFWNI